MKETSRPFFPVRITRLLEKILHEHLTLVCAADGTGKTTLLKSLCEKAKQNGLKAHFISADSEKSCFSEIFSLLTGRMAAEPLTDEDLFRQQRLISSAKLSQRLFIIADGEAAEKMLLKNRRIALLFSGCKSADFVFSCRSLNDACTQMALSLNFFVAEQTQLYLTEGETRQYALRCGSLSDPCLIHEKCGGNILYTRLFVLLEKIGAKPENTDCGELIDRLLHRQSKDTTAALIIASRFELLSEELCGKLSELPAICNLFGKKPPSPEMLSGLIYRFSKLIPLAEINRSTRTAKLHPLLKEAVLRRFITLPKKAARAFHVFFGRELLSQGRYFAAFCELVSAGEYELAAAVPYEYPLPLYLVNKNRRLLYDFALSCPLDRVKYYPQLMWICSLLLQLEKTPELSERLHEIIRRINASQSCGAFDKQQLLCLGYALLSAESFFSLSEMGSHIMRAFELFQPKQSEALPPNERQKLKPPLPPWGQYSPTVLFLIHREGAPEKTETERYTRYQHMYTDMLEHERCSDLIYTGELKLYGGDIEGALTVFSGISRLCAGTENLSAELISLYNAARCSLFLGESDSFSDFSGELHRLSRVHGGHEYGDCAALYLGLLRTLCGGSAADMWYALSAADNEPLINRFTLPYFSAVRLAFMIKTQRYEAALPLCEKYPIHAKAAGNLGAEAAIKLLCAFVHAALGYNEKAAEYAVEAFEAMQKNNLRLIAAEMYLISPKLYKKTALLLPEAFSREAENAAVLGSEFKRGTEIIRTAELSVHSGQSRNDSYLIPLERIAADYEALRPKMKLTPQAFRIAVLAASGLSNAEICRIMSLSENAVKSSLKRTFALTGAKNRRQLSQIMPMIY